MGRATLPWNGDGPYAGLIGVGAIGTGLFFALEGNHTLDRNIMSDDVELAVVTHIRPARLLDVRDYCKLHIIAHYVAVLLGAGVAEDLFHVLPVSAVGADGAGRSMIGEMARAGMDLRGIRTVDDRPTALSVCFQYPDGSGGNLTTDDSAAAALATADIDAAWSLLRAPARKYLAVAAPEVPLPLRLHFLRRASELGAFRVLCLTSADAVSDECRDLLAHADLIAMNEDEASALTGQPFPNDDVSPFLNRCAGDLQSYSRQILMLLTAGERGAFVFDGRDWRHRPALAVPVASSAGAGDALLAGVLSALAVGMPLAVEAPGGHPQPLESALDLGVTLAGFSVTSPHTIHPEARLEALLAFARQHAFNRSVAAAG